MVEWDDLDSIELSFEECLTLFESDQPEDLILAAKALAWLDDDNHPGLEKIYTLLLNADKKCPGVADTYWLEYFDCTIANDPVTIDWMFNVLEQRGQDQPLAVQLDGPDLEFHLHEAIDDRADDLIRAIKSGLTAVVYMALDHWTKPASSPRDFPADRFEEILRALRKSPHEEIRSLSHDFSKFQSRIKR